MSSAKESSLSAGERAFFEEGRTWDSDRIVELTNSRRTAWIVASAAAMIAVLAVIAVVGLTPLKKVEPFVFRVDNSTGQVDLVAPLRDAKETYTEAISKHFLMRYLTARESYSRLAASSNYEAVGLMSVPPVAKRYLAEFHPDNPESPLNVYGKSKIAEINIRSISFLGPSLAAVRYEKAEYLKTGDKPYQTSSWVATVGFKYSSADMKESQRLNNPLGFQVTEYRTDPETMGGKQ